MIRAERRAHRPDGDIARLAVVPDQRNHFFEDVRVILPLHPASVERMGAAVRERIAMIQVDAVRFHAACIDVAGDRADEALPLVFAFVATTGRKQDHRRSQWPCTKTFMLRSGPTGWHPCTSG